MQPKRLPNQDGSLEVLAARLQALPQPPVPADLEARLLAAMPPEMLIQPRQLQGGAASEERGTIRFSRRGWAVWVGALAAACFLVVFTRPARDGKSPVPIPPGDGQEVRVRPKPSGASDSVAEWWMVRGNLDVAESKTFSWPIQEKSPITVSTAIPPDLFE
jgi:hypothetical protein